MSFNYVYFEFISMWILFIAAIKEYELLYLCNNKQIKYLDNNANIIDMSVNCIFKRKFGELQVFMYPVTFILVALTNKLYFQVFDIYNFNYLYEFIVLCTLIMIVHVLVPYNLTYLNNYRYALLHGFKLKDWLDIRYRSITKKLLTTEEFKTESKFEYFKVFEKDKKIDFEQIQKKFLSLYKDLKGDTISEEISQEEYEILIPALNGNNIFLKEKGVINEYLVTEDNLLKIEKFEVSLGYQKMFYSIFKPVDLNVIFMSRFFEIIVFFAIIHYLILDTKQF